MLLRSQHKEVEAEVGKTALKVPSKTSACVRSIVTFQTAEPSFLIEFLFYCLWLKNPWQCLNSGCCGETGAMFQKTDQKRSFCSFLKTNVRSHDALLPAWHVCSASFISVAALPFLKFRLELCPRPLEAWKPLKVCFKKKDGRRCSFFVLVDRFHNLQETAAVVNLTSPNRGKSSEMERSEAALPLCLFFVFFLSLKVWAVWRIVLSGISETLFFQNFSGRSGDVVQAHDEKFVCFKPETFPSFNSCSIRVSNRVC